MAHRIEICGYPHRNHLGRKSIIEEEQFLEFIKDFKETQQENNTFLLRFFLLKDGMAPLLRCGYNNIFSSNSKRI